MSFFRTDQGIANQALFSGQRFIIYVEEDPDLDPGRAIDVQFWYEFFVLALKDIQFEIRGLGGKEHVLEMAKRVVSGDLPHTLCAMDRDYDDLFGRTLRDSRVFYTWGYGAENDLFGERAAAQLAAATIAGGTARAKHANAVWAHISKSIDLGRGCLLADQVTACRGRSALDRRHPTSVLELQPKTDLPLRFRRAPVKVAVSEARGAAVVHGLTRRPVACARWMPAHNYFELFYHTFVIYCSGYSRVKYNKEAIKNVVLSSLIGRFISSLDSAVASHYRGMARRKLGRFIRA